MVVHPLPDVSGLSVGILGGTGDQGRGLAYRLTRAGHAVRVGSRSAARGQAAAAELAALPGAGEVTGGDDPYACRGGPGGVPRALGGARGTGASPRRAPAGQ